MTFFYINSSGTEIDPVSEIFAVKNTVIMGAQTYIVSFHILPLSLLLYTPKLTDKKVIEIFPRYYAHNPGVNKEVVDNFYAELLFFRNKKNRNQKELVILGGLEKNMKSLREDVKRYFAAHNEYYKIMCLQDFVANKELAIYSFQKTDSIVQDPLFKNVLEDLADTDKMCYYDETILVHSKEISINDSEIPYLDYDDKIILNIPLFTIPSLDSLTYNQLKMIRTELHDLLKDFYEAVETFEKEIYFLFFDAKNILGIQERMSDLLLPIVNDIKEKVEGNIYFQQIINSVENPPLSTVKLGVSSLATMISFLRDRRIISEIDHGVILEKIDNLKLLDSCKVFFYHSLINKPKMVVPTQPNE